MCVVSARYDYWNYGERQIREGAGGEKDDVYPNLWRIRVYAGLRMHILQEFKRFAYSHPAKIFSQSRLAKAKWIECPSWKQPNEIRRRVTGIVAIIFAHRAAVRSNCWGIYDRATSSVFVSRVNDITRTMERRLNRVLLTNFVKPEVRRCVLYATSAFGSPRSLMTH